MDERPFLEFDFTDIRDPIIPELKKLTKAGFDAQALADSAAELKYTKGIKTAIEREFTAPSEEFVRFFAQEVYPGK